MDRLLTMTTFVRVVNYASFTAAAEDLGISRTLVSRQIADLEAHLGIRLLHRTTRSVAPTPAGQRYHDLCVRVLGEIRKGEDDITAIKQEIEGDIAILCPIWIGNFGVSEATAEFCALHPKVSVRLQFAEPSANPHEFLDRGFDICMQPNKLRDSAVMVRKIGEIAFVLVASPSYLKERGNPKGLDDLTSHDCLAKLGETHWSFEGKERVSLRNPARFSSNSVFSLCSSAVAGLGIAMLPDKIAERDIAAGHLRLVLPDHPLEKRPLYVAFAPGGDVARRIRALITYLADWFQRKRPSNESAGRVAKAYEEIRAR